MERLLPDVCKIQYGFAFDSSKFSADEGVPLIRIRDVVRGFSETCTTEECSEDYIVNDGDMLIGMDGEFNIAHWKGGRAYLNQRVCKLIPNDEIDGLYLFYFMPKALKAIEDKTPFVTVKHLSAKELNKIIVPVPSIEQQKKMAEHLRKVDELIALRKEQLAKLDELVKARFVEMFGDVVHNTKRWPIHQFSQVAYSRLGKMLDSKRQTGHNSYPYLANFNVQWFRFELDNLNRMDFSEADRQEFELLDGDLLVCEGGEIGRCAVWHNEIQPCYFQKALHRVRCNRDVILPDYLAWWFKFNCDHHGFAEIEGAKATIAHLPGAKLKQLPVAVPPLELQEKFTSFVEQTDRMKLTIQAGLDKLEVMKKALMQEYFG